VVSLLASGCTFHADTSWTEQLEADGPCYAANLADGLSTTDTQELHDVYACVNQGGTLEGFRALDEAWDTSTREGDAGLVFARWLADVETEGTSLSELLDTARSWIEDPSGLLDGAHLALELAYGRPWPEVPGLALADPVVLGDGLLTPVLPLLGGVAGVLLDGAEVRGPLVELLRSEALLRIAWSVAAAEQATSGPLATLAAEWPEGLSDLRTRSVDSSNDRWEAATGDSLRDAVGWLLLRQASDGRYLLDVVVEPALPILRDPVAADRVAQALADEAARGSLSPFPSELVHLVSVDARGGSLEAGEPSALYALVRLLDATNTEVECSVDLGFTELEFSFGNLAVELLTTFAELDPDSATDGVSLFGDLLGVPLSEDVLELVADSGVCPAIDSQFVDDLHALDRLSDPQSENTLSVFLALLRALDDHIPDLVDTLGALYGSGLLPPVEELVRDTADAPLVSDVVGLVPVLLEPEAWYRAEWMPAGVEPVGFDDVWDWAGELLDPATSPLPALRPLLEVTLDDGGLWTTVDRFARLAAAPGAESRALLPLLADALAADPELDSARSLADALEADSVRPLLVLLEGPGLRDALAHSERDTPGPVPTAAGWVVDGTLDTLLRTLNALLSLLDGADA